MAFKKGHKINNGRKQTLEHIKNVRESVVKRRIEKICKNCSTLFCVPPCRKNTISFCSKKCYSISMKNKPSWNKGLKGFRAGEKRPNIMKKGPLNKCYKLDRNSLVKNEKKHLDYAYKDWMLKVKNRDNWKCKINNNDCCGRLEAHHILPWRNYYDLRYDINNGITLCHFHHPRKHSEEIRLSPYFKKLLTF